MRSRFYVAHVFAVSALLIMFPSSGARSGLFSPDIKIPDQKVIDTVGGAYGDPSGGGTVSFFIMSGKDFAKRDISLADRGRTVAVLQSYLDDLAAIGPHPDVKASVHIEETPMANAFALPNGNITVTSGMLDMLNRRLGSAEQRSDAIGFILAHEYAHVLLNHPAEKSQKKSDIQKLGGVLTIVSHTLGIGKLFNDSSLYRQCVSQGREHPANVILGSVTSGEWVQATLSRTVYKAYSQKQESDADFLATDLLYRSGHLDPVSGSEPLVSIFPEEEETAEEYMKWQLDQTEATIKNALTDLEACAPQMIGRSLSGGNIRTEIETYVVGFLWKRVSDFFDDLQGDTDAHLHHDSDDRVESVKEYSLAFYPDQMRQAPAPANGVWGDDWGTVYTEEDKLLDLADRVRTLVAQGRADEAYEAAEGGLRPSPRPPMGLLLAGGAASVQAGKLDRAINLFEQAARRDNATALVYRQLSDLYLLKEQKANAVSALSRGEQKFGDGTFIVERIAVYQHFGDTPAMMKSVADCRAVGDKDLTESCERTAGVYVEKDKNLFQEIGDDLGKIVD